MHRRQFRIAARAVQLCRQGRSLAAAGALAAGPSRRVGSRMDAMPSAPVPSGQEEAPAAAPAAVPEAELAAAVAAEVAVADLSSLVLKTLRGLVETRLGVPAGTLKGQRDEFKALALQCVAARQADQAGASASSDSDDAKEAPKPAATKLRGRAAPMILMPSLRALLKVDRLPRAEVRHARFARRARLRRPAPGRKGVPATGLRDECGLLRRSPSGSGR